MLKCCFGGKFKNLFYFIDLHYVCLPLFRVIFALCRISCETLNEVSQWLQCLTHILKIVMTSGEKVLMLPFGKCTKLSDFYKISLWHFLFFKTADTLENP